MIALVLSGAPFCFNNTKIYTIETNGLADKLRFVVSAKREDSAYYERIRAHFAVVGLSEKVDESLLLLKRSFGWKNIFYIKANVNKNRLAKEEVSKGTLNII